VLGSVVDVADAGYLARDPPRVFTLREPRAGTQVRSPAIPADITAVAAEVRRCGWVSSAHPPAHPALLAAGAQANRALRRLRHLIPPSGAPSLQDRLAPCHPAAERMEAMWRWSLTHQRKAQSDHSACVGGMRAARMAGTNPAAAPMSRVAASPPAQAGGGMTMAQPLAWA